MKKAYYIDLLQDVKLRSELSCRPAFVRAVVKYFELFF